MNITIKSDTLTLPTIKELKPGTAFLYSGILYIRVSDTIPITISEKKIGDDIAIVLNVSEGFSFRWFDYRSRPDKILGKVKIV